MVDNKTIYEAHWHEWEAMKRHGPMSRHARRLVMRECCRFTFSSLLDVGCGPGVFLYDIHTRFPSILCTGIDVSESAVSIAAKRYPKVRFDVLDITEEIPTHSVDIVTMIDVAEHLERDTDAFRNIRRICNRACIILTLEGRMREAEKDIGHVRNYGKKELTGKLCRAGFRIDRFVRWGWPFYSPLYRNISSKVKSHEKPLTLLNRCIGEIFYGVLFWNLPGHGDLVVAVATPA